MKIKGPEKTAVPVLQVNESVSLEEQIAQRVHELWQHRGGEHGSDLTNWLHAEREINEWHRKRLEAKASSTTAG